MLGACLDSDCILCQYWILIREAELRMPRWITIPNITWIKHLTPQWGEGIGVGMTAVYEDGQREDAIFYIRPSRDDGCRYVPFPLRIKENEATSESSA